MQCHDMCGALALFGTYVLYIDLDVIVLTIVEQFQDTQYIGR